MKKKIKLSLWNLEKGIRIIMDERKKIKLGNRDIIYYKPRNSQIDKLYHDMIQLYNESVDIKNKIKTSGNCFH